MLATVANARSDEVLATDGAAAALPNALTEGFQAAFLGGAVIAALGLVLTLVLIRAKADRTHHALEPGGERLAAVEA